ncbi:5'-nucleotidase domain-containing protein 1-like [Babylonia areolata]|uniref:5'-nucleotidase domain-containing protein 1-like n=1 Tax=Babylonia areolata TaxID=304850 RepID=UPI003FD2E235
MRPWTHIVQTSLALAGRVGCAQNNLGLRFVHRRSSVTSLEFHSRFSCTLRHCLHRTTCAGSPFYVGDFRLYPRRLYQTTTGMASDRNPTICFQEYDALGFDLDHTIAKYKLVALFNVAYKCVTTFLVNEKGYDPSIKDDLHKYKDFICKGLFLDVSKGNILKLAPDGTILRATHGTHLMPKDKIQEAYGKDMKWEQIDTVKKSMRNPPTGFRFFENYFDCPGLVATARIIDIIDQKSLTEEERVKLYTKAWEDVLQSLHNMYDPSNFSTEKGGYFAIVKEDASKFVEECSADIRRWLKSLQQPGRMVFLLTSSQIDYASCLLEVCLGNDWQSYFDISLFRGRKPAFFTDNNPFYALEGHEEGAVVSELQRGGCYSQGNINDFNKFLAKELGKEDFKVVYFGDNICADSYPSKQLASWDAVLILEEMDAEGYECSDDTVPGHQLDSNQDVEPSSKKKKVLEHSSLVTQEEMDYLLTEFWGPFMVHQDTTLASPVATFWGDIIVRYSDIAVPSLEYLAGVPLEHKFECFIKNGTTTSGFHPGRPSSLLP